MRTRRSRIKMHPLFTAARKKDREANTYVDYKLQGDIPCIIYDPTGKIQAETYGEHLKYIRNVKVDGKYAVAKDGKRVKYILEDGKEIMEGYGIAVTVGSEPDYRIVSIKAERYLRLELEKL